ncbi:MAG: hypothetical protein E6J90_40730 [Deltaproteobacteria bacterium]|nr:MAG: hypothetical protein E6J90_40730 [Deltaproteobacteria bacterium]
MALPQVRSWPLGAAAALALLLRAPLALGFNEDVCFPPGGGPPYNCLALPPVCEPVGTISPACLAAALVSIGADEAAQKHLAAERSLLHADCVNLLAQAVGFSPDDASWISAYGEVPDYGQFEPTDMKGKPYGAYKTAEMNGFRRDNFTAGGLVFHWVPTYKGGSASAPAAVDGLHPSTSAPSTEYFIAHLRAWAIAGTGASPLLCRAGLTNKSNRGDYATGNGCFALDGKPAPITFSLALVAGKSKTNTFDSGLLPIESADGHTVPASDFDATVGGGAARVADARLGIYLHALADRISHHACLDRTAMAGPSSSGSSTWSMAATPLPDCGQDHHSLFHMWESGVDFAKIPPAHRTTPRERAPTRQRPRAPS